MTSAVVVVERQTGEQLGGNDPAIRRGPLARAGILAGAHAAAALILIWPAVWNGFPLIFSDSGTYLGQALARYLGWDRPPFYSFFLLATNWGVTLWLSVLAQALLTAHLLGLVLRVLNRPEPLALLLTTIGLAALTPLPWLVSQLMPDLFTGYTVLTLWLLGFRFTAMSRIERVYVLLLACFAVAVHQSHLPLALGLAALGGLLLGARYGAREALRPTLRMATPALLAALALVSVNLVGRGKASLSPYGSVFLAVRMIYDGPGLDLARRECPGVGWKLCGALDRLPEDHNDFLWDANSPMQEWGGAMAWAPEASAIIHATLRTEPGGVLAAALNNAVQQLGRLALGDGLGPWPARSGPVAMVERFYPDELAALQASRQQTGQLLADAKRLVPLQIAAALLAIGILGWLVLRRSPRPPPYAMALIALVLAGVLGNAAIAGALSGPTDRYQTRIIWLLPFISMALLAALRLAPRRAPASLRPRFRR